MDEKVLLDEEASPIRIESVDEDPEWREREEANLLRLLRKHEARERKSRYNPLNYLTRR